MLNEGDVSIIEVEPTSRRMSYQGVVVSASDTPLVDNHGVQLVRVSSLNRAVRCWNQGCWMLHVRSELLVTVSLLIRQICIEIAFVNAEFEWNVDIVCKLLPRKCVKSLQMDCKDARH